MINFIGNLLLMTTLQLAQPAVAYRNHKLNNYTIIIILLMSTILFKIMISQTSIKNHFSQAASFGLPLFDTHLRALSVPFICTSVPFVGELKCIIKTDDLYTRKGKKASARQSGQKKLKQKLTCQNTYTGLSLEADCRSNSSFQLINQETWQHHETRFSNFRMLYLEK